MRYDIDPKSIQQVIVREFASLRAKLKMARTEEEKVHLIIDTQQYICGLRDFYISAVLLISMLTRLLLSKSMMK